MKTAIKTLALSSARRKRSAYEDAQRMRKMSLNKPAQKLPEELEAANEEIALLRSDETPEEQAEPVDVGPILAHIEALQTELTALRALVSHL